MELLKTESLSKVYGRGEQKTIALDNVNLKIQRGEFIAITGTSGSGKSTLLHILGGVDKPTEGNVFIENINLLNLDETQLAIFRRRQIGIIYQFYNLVPILTVKENIELPILLDNNKVDNEKFDEIIKMLGLENKLNDMPSQLSGGQQQKVAIARALITFPYIILADEPTGNLDSKNSKEVFEFLKYSNKKYNQTIIMVTHNEELALQTDRIIKLEDGKIIVDKKLK